MRRFDHILIANRGEIAVRVIRTAQALGYRCTAVHSQADADAPHVRLADEARLLGPGPAAQSYLDIGRILDAAEAAGAGAIHPGYGFLSENADFARACEERGIVFIGPSAGVIDLMGNKARAKERMIAAGVPCVPGYQGDQDDATLIAAARAIGYPVMIKAAAGGGGRGMRLAHDDAALAAGLPAARSEALNAFGSAELILEKAIARPRHIEVQVIADAHGNVLHLGERDCSVQRRHQKIVEEAPSPFVGPAMRAAMTGVAIEAARAIDYLGAGTVEFIVDERGAFYFIEMNTRLQVEHPVTEAISGVDLVAEQIRLAQGLPLSLRQEEVAFSGHAVEVRLYAEDPANGFLPSTGRIHVWRPPEGPGIRVDAGISEGQAVSPFYDPMLAKIIAHGADRDEALRRLSWALEETVLFGPETNIGFLKACLGGEAFAAGQATTAFIAETFGDRGAPADGAPPAEAVALAAALLLRAEGDRMMAAGIAVSAPLRGWSSGGPQPIRLTLEGAGRAYEVVLHGDGSATVDGENAAVELIDDRGGTAAVRIGGTRLAVPFLILPPSEIRLLWRAGEYRFARPDPLAAGEDAAAATDIAAPMHGSIVALFVGEGEEVAKGARLVILEAMKMQIELTAPVAARVAAIRVRPGEQVAMGALLIELDPLAA